MIILALTSFLAGVLTILSPCTLPLLPVILGSSIHNKNIKRTVLVITSLAVSVFIFTLALKTTTEFFAVEENTLRVSAGLIIFFLGIFYLFPRTWDTFIAKIHLNNISSNTFSGLKDKGELASAVLTGAALGPIFTSCSPTYGYILFAVLPSSFPAALLYLILFILGMALFLILIALAGQKIISKTRWAAAPKSRLRKFLGILFIPIGILVIFKIDKAIESLLLEQKIVQDLLLNRVEQNIINSL